jgi:predicted ester cyclase
MSEQNKKLVRDSFDMLNKKDLKSLEGHLDPKFFAVVSAKANRAFTAFPDLNLTVDDMISEGDKVVTSWTLTGTHKGKVHQTRVGDVNPTHKQLKVTGVTIHRVINGKIVDTRGFGSELDALEQLGLVGALAKAAGHQ